MEVSRIGFLKLIFTQEEKLSRFDSECRDIFDGCYEAGAGAASSSLPSFKSIPSLSARENEIYDLPKRRPRRFESVAAGSVFTSFIL